MPGGEITCINCLYPCGEVWQSCRSVQEVNAIGCAGAGGSVMQCGGGSGDVHDGGNGAACGRNGSCRHGWGFDGDVDALQDAGGVPDYEEGNVALVHDKDGRAQEDEGAAVVCEGANGYQGYGSQG